MKKWKNLSALMKLTWIVSVCCFLCIVLIFLSGFGEFLDPVMGFLIVVTILSGGSALLLWITALILAIARKCKKEWSPYPVFALVDLALLAVSIVYAVYDFKTGVGFGAGLEGMVVLICAVPVLLGLLFVEAIIYFIWKRK